MWSIERHKLLYAALRFWVGKVFWLLFAFSRFWNSEARQKSADNITLASFFNKAEPKNGKTLRAASFLVYDFPFLLGIGDYAGAKTVCPNLKITAAQRQREPLANPSPQRCTSFAAGKGEYREGGPGRNFRQEIDVGRTFVNSV